MGLSRLPDENRHFFQVLCEVQEIFPLILPGDFFPHQAQVVFLHIKNNHCFAEHKGPLEDLSDLWQLCFPSVLNSISLTEKVCLAASWPAPPCNIAIHKENHTSHLICFLSLRDLCIPLFSIQCHENCSFVYSVQIFNYLRRECKSSLSYYLLAGSRNEIYFFFEERKIYEKFRPLSHKRLSIWT